MAGCFISLITSETPSSLDGLTLWTSCNEENDGASDTSGLVYRGVSSECMREDVHEEQEFLTPRIKPMDATYESR